MESILQTSRDRCFFCGRSGPLDEHHLISGTAGRKKSEKYGLKVYICRNCHLLHDCGYIQFDNTIIKEKDIKAMAQKKWEETYGKENPREEFRAIYGKSWL